MTIEETIWLAAYLEGEGCFSWTKSKSNGKTYHYPLISVGSTDLDVIERAARIIGTASIHCVRLKRVKPFFRIAVGGKRSVSIMKKILPYMGRRRTAKIMEVIKLSDARPGANKGHKAYQAKLGPDAVKEIRNSNRKTELQFHSEMASKYGVCDSTIWNVAHDRTYGDN